MRPVTIITSFPPDAWDAYAREFVEGFLLAWPDYKLVIYHEEDASAKRKLDHARIRWMSLWDIEYLKDFVMTIGQSPPMRGVLQGPDGKKAYSYRHDAYRWARKSFAIHHAATTYPGIVVWLDADIVTHSRVPDEFIEGLFPPGVHHAYLGREAIHMYSETGFLGFDTMCPGHDIFMKTMRAIWLSGAFQLLSEWHCCHVFDFTRKLVQTTGNNLTPKTYGGIHPFINSVLGDYMDHRKGGRKESRSAPSERVVPSLHPYWQEEPDYAKTAINHRSG